MSDRIKGFVVVLGKDYKDEDAEQIKQAISMLKGVISVKESVADAEDHMNRERIRSEYAKKLINVLRDE